MLRKTALAFALLFGAAPLLAAPASATPHEQEDGCDHGATGKPCRPDPQPTHGKDCELHGNHGGVNEDHCLTNPTTSTTTTSTTSPATTDTTTATALTTTTSAPVSVTPNLGCVTPDGHPYLTNVEQGGCNAATPTATEPAPPTAGLTPAATRLADTGWDAGLLFVIGTAVLLAGLSCWFCGKAIE